MLHNCSTSATNLPRPRSWGRADGAPLAAAAPRPPAAAFRGTASSSSAQRWPCCCSSSSTTDNAVSRWPSERARLASNRCRPVRQARSHAAVAPALGAEAKRGALRRRARDGAKQAAAAGRPGEAAAWGALAGGCPEAARPLEIARAE